MKHLQRNKKHITRSNVIIHYEKRNTSSRVAFFNNQINICGVVMENMIKRIAFGDMDAVYRFSEEGHVSFTIVPKESQKLNFEKGKVDPLVQISCTGDSSCPGFAAGETRHDSGLTMSMKYISQTETVFEGKKVVTTIVENPYGIRAEHIVKGTDDCRGMSIFTRVINQSTDNIMLEALSSFCISEITPYANNEAVNRLLMHRFRSRWSAEGRHEVRAIEDLMLETSWSSFGVRCEKFGAIGSMPVRGFFPFLAIEDTDAGVVWGVTNACSSSWQIETVRIDSNLCISGGLADYEYGHWRKELKPGDDFMTPKAFITVSSHGLDEVCNRLLDCQKKYIGKAANKMKTLPAVFNEYCTTWGEPSEEKITEILSVVNGNYFDYFVIDAGWYADSIKGWQDNMGDWRVARDLFPNGMKPVVDKINSAGMKAGIWFELEVVGKDADAVNEESHLLTRDGKVIISGTRRFWDMRSKWVNDYLTNKVINFLIENRFEYIKIDYNDTIGIGCDGAESPGEGLRQSVEATKSFFRKIRECCPDIAIEICASGGHRLEPGFMELADYLSFSDAHEEKEIPVIAADLHRLVLPSKSQIWAVIRKTDELKRIVYSICAGLYGVLCISGDVSELSDEQWELVRRGVFFYKKVSEVIANGVTKKYGPFQKSNRLLKEYQATVRYGENGSALVIVHSFACDGAQEITVPLNGRYYILDQYETGQHNIEIIDSNILFRFEDSFDAVAVLIKKV